MLHPSAGEQTVGEEAPLTPSAALPLAGRGAEQRALPTTVVVENAVLVVRKFILGDKVWGGAPETEKAGPTVPPGSMETQEGLEERNILSTTVKTDGEEKAKRRAGWSSDKMAGDDDDDDHEGCDDRVRGRA